MPKLDLDAVEAINRTGYPAPFDEAVEGRWYRRLAAAGGLTELRASHVVLHPGAWSSQRHWHALEDELVIMLSGEAVLVEDGGEQVLRAGDIAAFAKGVANGHHLQNRSDADCCFVAVSAGDYRNDSGDYPDIDLAFDAAGGKPEFRRKDGRPYPARG